MPLRYRGKGREPRYRLEAEARGIGDVLGERGAVGEEDGVELRRLGALGELLVKADVEEPGALRRRIPPPGLVMAARVEEEVERELVKGHCEPQFESWVVSIQMSAKFSLRPPAPIVKSWIFLL